MSNLGALVFLLVTCSAHLYACDAHSFCSRAVASRSCPTPPTVDGFDLDSYLGRWFEIGSTARFKLSTEAGDVCDQAVYSSTAGTFRLLNSALRVIDGAAQIRRVTTAASAICSGARNACFQLPTASQVSHVLQSMNSSQSLDLAHQLASSAEATALHLHRIAQDVTRIQQLNALISQANASSLQSSVAGIEQLVDKASREQSMVAGLVGGIKKISERLREMSQRSGVSVKARGELEDAYKAVAIFAAEVERSSTSMKLALKALRAQATGLLSKAQPIGDPHVSFARGTITQPSARSPAKLEVSINGIRAPYWIIALERDSKGAYSAAMVYSCRDVAGVIVAKSLFVLSKEPRLEHATLRRFLAKADMLGIYNDCEDPFLLTIQRGGTCGRVHSSSSSD